MNKFKADPFGNLEKALGIDNAVEEPMPETAIIPVAGDKICSKKKTKVFDDEDYMKLEMTDTILNVNEAISMMKDNMANGCSERAFEVLSYLFAAKNNSMSQLLELNDKKTKALLKNKELNNRRKTDEKDLQIKKEALTIGTANTMLEMLKEARKNSEVKRVSTEFSVVEPTDN